MTSHLCPSNAAHGEMELRPESKMTQEQRWCGTWYDCPRCHSSLLVPAPALEVQNAFMQRDLARAQGRLF